MKVIIDKPKRRYNFWCYPFVVILKVNLVLIVIYLSKKDYVQKKDWICHQNIRGLQGKFDFSQILNNNKIDIFFLMELFLNNINFKFIISGYEFWEKIGKMGVAVKLGFLFERYLFTREEDDIKSIFIEIFPKNSKSFAVGTIYQPPNSSKHLSKDLVTVLSRNR